MIKAILVFLFILGLLYSGYSYTKSMEADELERFVATACKVLAVLVVGIVLVVCIIMIF